MRTLSGKRLLAGSLAITFTSLACRCSTPLLPKIGSYSLELQKLNSTTHGLILAHQEKTPGPIKSTTVESRGIYFGGYYNYQDIEGVVVTHSKYDPATGKVEMWAGGRGFKDNGRAVTTEYDSNKGDTLLISKWNIVRDIIPDSIEDIMRRR